eukprot:scaffold1377_cov220-Pinguiococcus_pyrenoidosus.AAC.1
MAGKKGRSGRKALPESQRKATRTKRLAAERKWRSRAAERLGEKLNCPMCSGPGRIVDSDCEKRLYKIKCGEDHISWLSAQGLKSTHGPKRGQSGPKPGPSAKRLKLVGSERTRRRHTAKTIDFMHSLAKGEDAFDTLVHDVNKRVGAKLSEVWEGETVRGTRGFFSV